jgi:hypothetical protein
MPEIPVLTKDDLWMAMPDAHANGKAPLKRSAATDGRKDSGAMTCPAQWGIWSDGLQQTADTLSERQDVIKQDRSLQPQYSTFEDPCHRTSGSFGSSFGIIAEAR